MKLSRLHLRLGTIAMVAGIAATPADARAFRLFFSSAGLSDSTDTLSPAETPVADFNINPDFLTEVGQSARLYVWAKFEPAGTPNSVVYNGVSFNIDIYGAGEIIGHSFWNYTNGTYGGNAGRWQHRTSSHSAMQARFQGVAVTYGAGVNNTAAAHANDRQHLRFAPDGVTRIDATLLGYVDVMPTLPGGVADVFLTIGSSGITQLGEAPQPIYFGWNDPPWIPGDPPPFAHRDARVLIPEPAALALPLLAGLLRRRRAANRPAAPRA
jgi:hypothetical protein